MTTPPLTIPFAKCDRQSCTNVATGVVHIEAYVRAGSEPIHMTLGIKICDDPRCLPPLSFISDRMWNILDSWAIQAGKPKGLCDREMTKIYRIPFGSEDAQQVVKRRG